MKTVILCGGFGTRIRDVAADIPKPMIAIGRYPILWHIMKYYACADFRRFVLCLGHQGDVIRDFFLNYDTHTRDFTVTLGKNGGIETHGDGNGDNWRVTLLNS